MSKPVAIIAVDNAINEFLTHKRTLGRDYRTEESILRNFRRFLRSEGCHDLDQKAFDRWCEKLDGLSANTRRSRQLVIRKFCLYRQRNDPTCYVPDPLYFARQQPYRSPVLIEPGQIAELLAEADTLTPSANSPLRGSVLRMAIVLLYTAGLRRGEVARLTVGDIDASDGIIRVRESKFHKSRIVPLSESARLELQRYLCARDQQGCSQTRDAALLCNRARGWRGYTGAGLGQGIGQLLDSACVRDTQGRRPRIHDFRHSFAVQSLIRLYQNNEDVQSKLPHLALYMGHVSIVSTAYYLHFVPTLASLASERFEQCCADVLGVSCDEN